MNGQETDWFLLEEDCDSKHVRDFNTSDSWEKRINGIQRLMVLCVTGPKLVFDDLISKLP